MGTQKDDKKYSEIIIKFDDENKPEDTIRYVLGLVEEGYTSGYYPHWEMKKEVV